MATAPSQAPLWRVQALTTQGKSDEPSGSEAASALRTTSDCAISCLEAVPLSRRMTCDESRISVLDAQHAR